VIVTVYLLHKKTLTKNWQGKPDIRGLINLGGGSSSPAHPRVYTDRKTAERYCAKSERIVPVELEVDVAE
jgi:hypothetical protein